jgi:ubiquinone/menaquinone biosynthesis C-methylase UbiE
MTTAHEPYLKAMGSDRFVRFYDLVVGLAMRERKVRLRVIARARLGPGQRLLDLGCGTGTLAILAQRRHPRATVVGVDGDPVVLGIARGKARRAGVPVRFDEGMAYALPYDDGSFDAVTATLMLHHLTHDQQERTLAEVWRVLRPGGRFVIADFAPPHNRRMALASRVARLLMHLHGAGNAPHGGHRHGQLGQDLAARGWQDVASPEPYMTLVGTLALVCATRPLDDTAAPAAAASARARS